MALKVMDLSKESRKELMEAVVHLVEKVKTISTLEAMNALTEMGEDDNKDLFIFMQDYLFVKILAYVIQLTLNNAYTAQSLLNKALLEMVNEETEDNQP